MRLHKLVCRMGCAFLSTTILLAAIGCKNGAVATVAETSNIPVQVQKAQKGTLTQSSEFIGTVEPNDLVSVSPRLGGSVLVVNFKVGDTVKKGDILFEVDPIDIQLSLAAQQASLAASQAGVLTAQAQVDQQLGSGFDMQLAQVETQVESAKKQYSAARQSLRDYNDGKDDSVDKMIGQLDQLRTSLPLLESKVEAAEMDYRDAVAANDGTEVSKKVLWDKAKDTLRDAESTISMLGANINDADDADATARQLRTAVSNAQLAYDSSNTIYELTKGDARSDALKVANASLKQATAGFEAQAKSYEAAAHQLTYTKTIAPIDGVIEARDIYENTMTSPQNIAFVISDKTAVAATFYVSADAVRQMEVGDRVRIESGVEEFAGTLTEVGSMVDPQIGLFKVKAAVEGGSGIMTGVSVKIIAETAKAVDVLLIPQSAVHYETGKAYVYLYRDGLSVKTFIDTGVANNEVIEVTAGMTALDDLIVTWNPNLRDGAVVEIKTKEQPAADQMDGAQPEATQEEQA